MPFISSPSIPWAHLQHDDDPIRAIAERAEPQIASQLAAAWNALYRRSVRRAFTPEQMIAQSALGRMEAEMAVEALSVAHELVAVRQAGFQAMAATVGLPLDFRKDFMVGFGFGSPLAPPVQEQADLYAVRFVREISDDVRSTLAGVVQDAVARGLGPPETARTLRESIGLTRAQAGAVQNYRRMLEGADPAAAERALHDDRFGSNVADLSPQQIDARVEAYRRRYVAYRAATIARYETLQASNAGAVSAIQIGVTGGTLPKGTVKTWMIAKDEYTCPRCRSIPQIQPNGVPVDGSFLWRHNRQEGYIKNAPLHPSCRCTNSFRVIR